MVCAGNVHASENETIGAICEHYAAYDDNDNGADCNEDDDGDGDTDQARTQGVGVGGYPPPSIFFIVTKKGFPPQATEQNI